MNEVKCSEEWIMTEENHEDMVENEIPWGMGFERTEQAREDVFREDEMLQLDHLDDENCLGEPGLETARERLAIDMVQNLIVKRCARVQGGAKRKIGIRHNAELDSQEVC